MCVAKTGCIAPLSIANNSIGESHLTVVVGIKQRRVVAVTVIVVRRVIGADVVVIFEQLKLKMAESPSGGPLWIARE